MITVSVLHTIFNFSKNFPLSMLAQLSWHRLLISVPVPFIIALQSAIIVNDFLNSMKQVSNARNFSTASFTYKEGLKSLSLLLISRDLLYLENSSVILLEHYFGTLQFSLHMSKPYSHLHRKYWPLNLSYWHNFFKIFVIRS